MHSRSIVRCSWSEKLPRSSATCTAKPPPPSGERRHRSCSISLSDPAGTEQQPATKCAGSSWPFRERCRLGQSRRRCQFFPLENKLHGYGQRLMAAWVRAVAEPGQQHIGVRQGHGSLAGRVPGGCRQDALRRSLSRPWLAGAGPVRPPRNATVKKARTGEPARATRSVTSKRHYPKAIYSVEPVVSSDESSVVSAGSSVAFFAKSLSKAACRDSVACGDAGVVATTLSAFVKPLVEGSLAAADVAAPCPCDPAPAEFPPFPFPLPWPPPLPLPPGPAKTGEARSASAATAASRLVRFFMVHPSSRPSRSVNHATSSMNPLDGPWSPICRA